jgi:hypothetical protein
MTRIAAGISSSSELPGTQLYLRRCVALCSDESTESFRPLLSGQAVNLGGQHSRENNMKSSLQIKKISVRRTGDIRLTSAMCTGSYHLAA